MTVLKVYCTHWSDAHQHWGEPRWVEEKLRELGLPFGYFLAEDGEKAKEFVKTLPPLRAVSLKDTYPEGFSIGWAKIPEDVAVVWRPE